MNVGSLSPLQRLMRAMIRGYQYATSWRMSPCRHVPGCSTYAFEAIEAHGAVRGVWLATWRVCRCHPWGTSGYDPVPAKGERQGAELVTAGATIAKSEAGESRCST